MAVLSLHYKQCHYILFLLFLSCVVVVGQAKLDQGTSSSSSSSSSAQEITEMRMAQAKEECMQTIMVARNEIHSRGIELEHSKQEYLNARRDVIKHKRYEVSKYLNTLETKLEVGCRTMAKQSLFKSTSTTTTSSSSNKMEDNKLFKTCMKKSVKKYLNEGSIRDEANQLRDLTTKLARRYMERIAHVVEGLQQQEELLDGASKSIDEFCAIHGSQHRIEFRTHTHTIANERAKALHTMSLLRDFKVDLESVVYGTMCLDVVGASGEIDTKQEKLVFQHLTEDAIEVACAELELDADMVQMSIIKQQFIKLPSHTEETTRTSSSSSTSASVSSKIIAKKPYIHTPSTTTTITNNGDTERKLNDSDKQLHRRLRTSLSNRRELNFENSALRLATLVGVVCRCDEDSPMNDIWTRRQRRRLVQKEEDNSIQHDDDDDDDEEEEATTRMDVVAAVSTKQKEMRPPLLHKDVFLTLEQGRRQLEGEATTQFHQRYIQALTEAFEDGPLAGVVEVHQIECEGFLSAEEALDYIKNLE